MIFETRQLVFTNTALRNAFAWYQTVPNQTELPHGIITSVIPRAGGGATVYVQQSGASKMREVSFLASKTLAVLLYFCRKQRIPIPRDAGKDIAASDDSIILTIENRLKTSGPAG
jgi:hypothetical protein